MDDTFDFASPVMQPSSSSAQPSKGRTQPATSSSPDAFAWLANNGQNQSSRSTDLSMAQRLAQTRSSSNSPSLNPPPVSSEPTKSSADAFDLDALVNSTSKASLSTDIQASYSKPEASSSLLDFEFSNDVARPTGPQESVADDDILGDLAKPVSVKPIPPVTRITSQSQSQPNAPPSSARSLSPSPAFPTSRHLPVSDPSSSPKPTRPSSPPPPHILGQLVQMGFEIDASQSALQQTRQQESPFAWEIQAALDLLLVQQHQKSPSPRTTSPRAGSPAQHPSRPTADQLSTSSPPDSGQQPDLIAQASQLGANVFARANTLWNTSRMHLQKALDEQMAKHEQKRPTEPFDPASAGKPKWWVEGVQHHHEDDESSPVTVPDTSRIAQPSNPSSRSARKPSSTNLNPIQPQTQKDSSASPLDIFSFSEPQSSNLSSKPSSPSPSFPVRTPRPRCGTDASPEQLGEYRKYKQNGNDKFGLGQYGAAEEAYGRAIAALPESHNLRILVLNNRALTRVKLGMSKQARMDCDAVVKIILKADENAQNIDVLGVVDTLDFSGEDIVDAEKRLHFIDQLVKSLVQRAKAFEADERWKEAKVDWDSLKKSTLLSSALKTAQLRSTVNEGAKRCQQMLEPKPATTAGLSKSAATSARQAQPKFSRPADASKREAKAVTAHREKEDAQSREDEERFALKDSVDNRLEAWKIGKENNLRALLASLDMVLWPEKAKELKTGMHELVTPEQLKRRYTITISKLHPDKLPPGSTSLEHRMLANSVFASLNDAWASLE